MAAMNEGGAANPPSVAPRIMLVVFLSLSMSANSVLVKASNQGHKHTPYNFVVVTLMVETLKLALSVGFLAFHCMREGTNGIGLHGLFFARENVLFFVPAAIYTVTNNLTFLILERLDPGTVSVIWNLKIVTTALALRCIGRKLTKVKWFGIVMLTTGVMLSQADRLLKTNPMQIDDEAVVAAENEHQRILGGLLFCLVAIVAVTGANIFTEYLYKRPSPASAQLQLYARNCWLYAWGMLFNFCVLTYRNKGDFSEALVGYNKFTVGSIIFLASAGLLVGATFKFLDNIAVVFADMLAMLVQTTLSVVFFGLTLTMYLVAGALICMISLRVYYVGIPCVLEVDDKDGAYELMASDIDIDDVELTILDNGPESAAEIIHNGRVDDDQ